MSNVLIVGYGVVGQNLGRELVSLRPHFYDKYKPYHNTKQENIKYDFAFICVDTPFVDKDNPCDISEVHKAISENNANVYIIKSTILPNQVKELKTFHPFKKIVISPEYYGDTQHCNNFEFNFTILGGKKEDCLKVQQLLQNVYDARHTFHIVDGQTASLAKYIENCWLATKVSFCCNFWKLAEKEHVDYETLRELFILDPRVNPSHTFVYDEKPYWDSHCLNKDVRALAYSRDNDFLKFIVDFNEKMKK